jgi:hypothetical protein
MRVEVCTGKGAESVSFVFTKSKVGRSVPFFAFEVTLSLEQRCDEGHDCFSGLDRET